MGIILYLISSKCLSDSEVIHIACMYVSIDKNVIFIAVAIFSMKLATV